MADYIPNETNGCQYCGIEFPENNSVELVFRTEVGQDHYRFHDLNCLVEFVGKFFKSNENAPQIVKPE